MGTEPHPLSPRPPPPSTKKKPSSWSNLWLRNPKPLKDVVLAMQLQSLSCTPSPTPTNTTSKDKTPTPISVFPDSHIDRTILLTDDLLLKILSKLPDSQRSSNSLVCKRWLNLQDRLVRSLRLLDWEFLESGRLISRFPNLNRVDLVGGCVISLSDSCIRLTHRLISMRIGSGVSGFLRLGEENLLPADVVDRGLRTLAAGCPNLRKLSVVGASELGLLSVAEESLTLQDLELHKCNDNVLRGIAACENLQILKIVGNVDGFYSSSVSDVGLTILAQGCKRLVKLELSGCEGGFDGIKAIGQCCPMLEELTLSNHRMESGWLAALSYCENLKTLRFLSCERIDPSPGPDEYLGPCPTLDRLHLQNCQLRDKKSVRAMFKVCETVRDIVVHNCWGLDDDAFNYASVCRQVRSVSLKGCSLLTAEGLESAVSSWNELECLRIESCKNIKDCEISPALSTMFTILKELKWKTDIKSLLASSLVGTGMGQKGGRFFKKSRGLKLLAEG